MSEQTVIIYDDVDGPLRFLIVEGDHRNLDRVYINSTEDMELQDKLSELLYDNESSSNIKPTIAIEEHFPISAIKNGAYVIVAGFLP